MRVSYLIALAVTLAVEVPVVAAFFAGQRKRMALAAALATTGTHVAMHFVLPRFTSSYDDNLLVGEILALAVEATIYALVSDPRDIGRALVAASVANALSYGAGLLLVHFGVF